MQRHEQQPLAFHVDRHLRSRERLAPGDRVQRVDHRVAGHEHVRCRDVFGEQVLPRQLGRREMQRGDRAGQAAIDLFRKRVVVVVTPQAGLDMRDRDLLVERRQARHEHRRRITLHDQHVRLFHRQCLLHRRQHAHGQLFERLPRPHHRQVDVRGDGEDFERLLQQLAML